MVRYWRMSPWPVVLWFVLIIVVQNAAAFLATAPERGPGPTFSAALVPASTVCFPALGYTSVTLAVNLSGLDATDNAVVTLDWSCPSLSQLNLTAISLASPSTGCLVDLTTPNTVRCQRTATAAFILTDVRVVFTAFIGFKDSTNVLSECLKITANGDNAHAAPSMADALLLAPPIAEPTSTVLRENSAPDSSSTADNITAMLDVSAVLTSRTEGLTVLAVMLAANGRLAYDMAATKVLVTESGDDEAIKNTKCVIKRDYESRIVELRCLGLPAGRINLQLTPVIVRVSADAVNSRRIFMRFAMNGKSLPMTMKGSLDNHNEDRRNASETNDSQEVDSNNNAFQQTGSRPGLMATQALPSSNLARNSSRGSLRGQRMRSLV